MAAGLRERHTLFAPSIAGHRDGPTRTLSGRLGFPEAVDLLERDLDAVGIQRAHLVGNSLGGGMAFELARRGRALSLILFSPSLSVPGNPEQQKARRAAGAAAVNDPAFCARLQEDPEARRSFMRVSMENGDRVTADELIGDRRDATGVGDLGDSIIGLGLDFSPVDVPVRVYWPERDRILPWETYGDKTVRRLVTEDVVRGQGTGHIPMYDDPDGVTGTILEFTAALADQGH